VTSLEEVRAVLVGVADDIRVAYELTATGRTGIVDAVAGLDRLGVQNSLPLPPPQLRRAADELDRLLGLLQAGAGTVADVAARL
jgi:hypothetical protein